MDTGAHSAWPNIAVLDESILAMLIAVHLIALP
jgi:hypothetical protein